MKKKKHLEYNIIRLFLFQIRDPGTDAVLGADMSGEILVKGVCLFRILILHRSLIGRKNVPRPIESHVFLSSFF